MGLKNALARLTGTQSPRLARPDSAALTVHIDRLEIHTAGPLIIVVTDQPGAEVLREVAGTRESATLASPTTTVHFPAVKKDALPIKDPRRGWVIPLTPALADALVDHLPYPGDYELSPALAVVVE
ncbi:hypothetical protein [Corynebacterium tuberculostearicum]|uniref:hypothetical protein n=1 Tax=Corynebacterium tuberculostearicum TaxID=38304 RepID=UPI0029348402|nr:hypothetical protein [Corynebacterium tuberculostearicum]MDV2421496.1 hypothetical protein [Corynebacterium tuberculostearicum]